MAEVWVWWISDVYEGSYAQQKHQFHVRTLAMVSASTQINWCWISFEACSAFNVILIALWFCNRMRLFWKCLYDGQGERSGFDVRHNLFVKQQYLSLTIELKLYNGFFCNWQAHVNRTTNQLYTAGDGIFDIIRFFSICRVTC